MKNISKFLVVMALTFGSGYGYSKWEDKSPLETVDMLRCTAAVMRAGMGIEAYKKWTSALEKRYKTIYKDKSGKEIDSYMSKRILEKRAELQRKGLQTAPAFKKYYDTNCADFHPQSS